MSLKYLQKSGFTLKKIELRFRVMFDWIDNYHKKSILLQKPSKYDYQLKDARYVRQKVIFHYTNGTMKCKCCGEKQIELLTLDHPNQDGQEKRKEKIHPHGGFALYRWLIVNNYKEQLDVLCWNCNEGRRINRGLCPHQDPKLRL